MRQAKKLSDVDVSRYDAIFVPGGLAPMVDMPEHPLLKQVVKETYERHALVGAVCHGPVALLNVKLSNGAYLLDAKNITSFTSNEKENYAKAGVPFDLETALTKQERDLSTKVARLAAIQHRRQRNLVPRSG